MFNFDKKKKGTLTGGGQDGEGKSSIRTYSVTDLFQKPSMIKNKHHLTGVHPRKIFGGVGKKLKKN